MKISLIGGFDKNLLEQRIQKVAAAGKLSRFKGNVFEVLDSCNDYEKNLNLIKRIIGMGHKSIIEHDYVVFAICDVTPIVEQTIIGNRLTSFTIKSRREVDFRNAGFYIPTFRDKDLNIHSDNEKLQKKYTSHIEFLFNTYSEFVDSNIKSEDARFILPYSFYSNIIMGLDARELEKLTISLLYGPLSKISELKELGDKFLEIIKINIPYLFDSIQNYDNTKINEDPFSYLEKISETKDVKIQTVPKLLSYTKNPDDAILISSIMYHFQYSKEEAEKILNENVKKDNFFKEKYMNTILRKEENRELEQVNFTFQIPVSLCILTHLTRHRMHSLLIPEFIPLWNFSNFIIPESISKHQELKLKFLDAQKKNLSILEEFKTYGVANEDLVYFYLGCQMLNVITTINARSLQWILRLRCCNKAQWQIRNISKQIAKEVTNVAPLLGKNLGPTCVTDFVCKEGKESCGLINAILKNREFK